MIILSSYPRSGHHFLIETLGYFNNTMTYCEKYTCENQFREAQQHCPYYARTQHPDVDPTPCGLHARIQKTHDHELDEPIRRDTGTRYLVMIRDPVPAILSRYRTDLLHHDHWHGDQKEFQQYFVNQLYYYTGFAAKWIREGGEYLSEKHLPGYYHDSFQDHQRVYVTYEDLVSDPDCLMLAMKYLSPGPLHRFLDSKRSEILSFVEHPVYQKPDYYDAKFCKRELAKHNLGYLRKRDGSALIEY